MYIVYNPNPSRKLTGDCVIRAITLVMDSDWKSTYMNIALQTTIITRREIGIMNSPINPMNPAMQQEYCQFCQNPIQYLTMRRINIPQQFQNDSRGAVQYLLNNGTMQQNAFNSFVQFCQSMGIRI